MFVMLSTIVGSLSAQQGAFWAWGRSAQHPGMERSWECVE